MRLVLASMRRFYARVGSLTSRPALRVNGGGRRRRITVSPRLLCLVLAVVMAGCAMRVVGTVRDRESGAPIAGALVTVDDGRGRVAVSDGNGEYALKTDWRPATLAVTASGFRSTTVRVPGDDRFPLIDVELDRAERLAPSPRE
jgi:hypothetical protein